MFPTLPVHQVLVTGGAGFIGSHLVDALVRAGHRVVVLDNVSTGRLSNLHRYLGGDAVTLVEGTVCDYAVVDRLVHEADVVYHLASTVGVQLVVSNPLGSLMNNVRGTDNVLSAAARHGKRVLFTSTSEVYGKNQSGALGENADRILGSPFKARWSYAIAKSFGEALAHGLHREHGAEAITVRLFNTVGPRQTGRYGMVLPSFVRQALSGHDLTVYGDGTQTRCFAHVNDTVRALVTLIDTEAAIGGVFNVGASTETSILALARRVIERTESTSQIRFVPYGEAYEEGFEELGKRKPDASALRALIGWEPELTVDDAIDDVAVYERAQATTLAA